MSYRVWCSDRSSGGLALRELPPLRVASGMRALIVLSYLLIFWLLLPALLLLPHLLPTAKETFLSAETREFLRLGGATLMAAGTAMMLWTTRALHRYGRGLPISHLPPRRLVCRGPFSFLRHPLYAGYLWCWLGLALLLPSWPVLCISLPLLTTGVFVYMIREEQGLRRRFPQSYRRYCALVPRRLGPGALLLHGLLLALTRLVTTLRLERPEDLPTEPAIVVAAHRNYLDPLFIRLALQRPLSFLTTHDMYRTRLTAALFRRAGCIRVDRYRANPAAVAAVFRVLHRGGMVGIFPSGGRSWDGSEHFSRNVERLILRARVRVIGVRLAGSYAHWPRPGSLQRRRVSVEVLPPRDIPDAAALHALMRELAAAPLALGARRPPRRVEPPADPAAAPALLGAPALGWHEYGLRSRDRVLGAVRLRLREGSVEVRRAAGGGGKLLLSLPYGSIDAVLIRGNAVLQVYASGELLSFRLARGLARAFQEALRLRSFGDRRQRRRDSPIVFSCEPRGKGIPSAHGQI